MLLLLVQLLLQLLLEVLELLPVLLLVELLVLFLQLLLLLQLLKPPTSQAATGHRSRALHRDAVNKLSEHSAKVLDNELVVVPDRLGHCPCRTALRSPRVPVALQSLHA